MRKIFTFFALAFVLLGAGSLLGKLLQCPKCGYEYEEGVAVCVHCGAALPAAAAAAAPAAPAKPAAAVSREVLDQEERAVGLSLKNDAPSSTILLARNTLALLRLVPDSDTKHAADILAAITGSENKLRNMKQRCFACRGTGAKMYSIPDMRGEIRHIQSGPGIGGCPVCGGTGVLIAHTPQTIIIAEMAKAQQAFEREQQSRGWENFGGVWLPPGVLAGLGIHDKVAVKTSIAGACPTCFGFGFFGCATCGGIGKLKCSNAKCVQGMEPCPVCKGKGKIAQGMKQNSAMRTCSNCAGLGASSCTICQGRGYIICAKCQTTGETQCMACKGNGESPICQKCDATGLIPCATCKGAGEIRGTPCPVCHGDKLVLCTTCNGSGHKPRNF